jgi:TRAP-type C4-dicarboxylate transport system permease large subunit
VGTIGMLIPPSISMIIYGIITEQSIGKLFLAGIIPGIMIAVLFIASYTSGARSIPNWGRRARRPSREGEDTKPPEFISVVVIFVIVIGGLMAGLFTPTEAVPSERSPYSSLLL